MRSIIEGIGIAVDDTATIADATAKCRQRLPDIIVLDWIVPGGNPLEFVSTLRSNSRGKQTPVLYVMTNNDPAEIAKARSAGVSEIMPKPFHRVQLEAKVLGLLAAPRDAAADILAQRPLMRAGVPAHRTAIEA